MNMHEDFNTLQKPVNIKASVINYSYMLWQHRYTGLHRTLGWVVFVTSVSSRSY